MSVWQSFLAIANIGEYLSVADIALTLIGFGITVNIALRATRAAEAAEAAAISATARILRTDFVAESATILQLLEELKRLQRSKAIDLLPDRYSVLRVRVVSIRASVVVSSPEDQTALQNVISRLTALEKNLDINPLALDNTRVLARCNESLSNCVDSIIAIKERLRSHG